MPTDTKRFDRGTVEEAFRLAIDEIVVSVQLSVAARAVVVIVCGVEPAKQEAARRHVLADAGDECECVVPREVVERQACQGDVDQSGGGRKWGADILAVKLARRNAGACVSDRGRR